MTKTLINDNNNLAKKRYDKFQATFAKFMHRNRLLEVAEIQVAWFSRFDLSLYELLQTLEKMLGKDGIELIREYYRYFEAGLANENECAQRIEEFNLELAILIKNFYKNAAFKKKILPREQRKFDYFTRKIKSQFHQFVEANDLPYRVQFTDQKIKNDVKIIVAGDEAAQNLVTAKRKERKVKHVVSWISLIIAFLVAVGQAAITMVGGLSAIAGMAILFGFAITIPLPPAVIMAILFSAGLFCNFTLMKQSAYDAAKDLFIKGNPWTPGSAKAMSRGKIILMRLTLITSFALAVMWGSLTLSSLIFSSSAVIPMLWNAVPLLTFLPSMLPGGIAITITGLTLIAFTFLMYKACSEIIRNFEWKKIKQFFHEQYADPDWKDRPVLPTLNGPKSKLFIVISRIMYTLLFSAFSLLAGLVTFSTFAFSGPIANTFIQASNVSQSLASAITWFLLFVTFAPNALFNFRAFISLLVKMYTKAEETTPKRTELTDIDSEMTALQIKQKLVSLKEVGSEEVYVAGFKDDETCTAFLQKLEQIEQIKTIQMDSPSASFFHQLTNSKASVEKLVITNLAAGAATALKSYLESKNPVKDNKNLKQEQNSTTQTSLENQRLSLSIDIVSLKSLDLSNVTLKKLKVLMDNKNLDLGQNIRLPNVDMMEFYISYPAKAEDISAVSNISPYLSANYNKLTIHNLTASSDVAILLPKVLPAVAADNKQKTSPNNLHELVLDGQITAQHINALSTFVANDQNSVKVESIRLRCAEYTPELQQAIAELNSTTQQKGIRIYTERGRIDLSNYASTFRLKQNLSTLGKIVYIAIGFVAIAINALGNAGMVVVESAGRLINLMNFISGLAGSSGPNSQAFVETTENLDEPLSEVSTQKVVKQLYKTNSMNVRETALTHVQDLKHASVSDTPHTANRASNGLELHTNGKAHLGESAEKDNGATLSKLATNHTSKLSFWNSKTPAAHLISPTSPIPNLT